MSHLPQERLDRRPGPGAAERAFDETVEFTKERKAFGQPMLEFQNTRFTAGRAGERPSRPASRPTASRSTWTGSSTAAEASHGEAVPTELHGRSSTPPAAHGGAGYMNEYPIARLSRDARVQRIYGGTSEIMKVLIARSL